MKDLKRIEELLEKYYRGESSTAEEKQLQLFFEGDVPDYLSAEAELFRYFNREKQGSISGELEERLDHVISGRGKPAAGSRIRYFWTGGIAAGILILIGIFVDLQIRKNSRFEVRQDTYEDPYIAYAEAKRVIYLVSEKMNTGREPLKKLEKLDAGVDYMHPVFSFGASIQHLEHLSVIEETREKIAK
jgi:hypothetical protein